ncbi:hypothetical protein U91I_02265 [alpha proteobacterium U9-1i]|nr:hypothetical protein U91I_02265 [alpha proteobacterium U9-1i]
MIYNETQQGVAGIIMRGAIDGLDATLHYLNIAYALHGLRAVQDGTEVVDYNALPVDAIERP